MKLESYQNPLFVRLIEESYINSSISLHRNDIESILIGLKYLNDDSNLYRDSREVVEDYLLKNSVNLQNIKIFILAKAVLSFGEKDIEIRKGIKKLTSSSAYPLGEKAHVLFLCSEIESYESECIGLSIELAKQGKESIRRNRDSVTILATFSLLTDVFAPHHISYMNRILGDNKLLTSADLLPLIKSAIYLKRNNIEVDQNYNSRIETIVTNLSTVNQSPEFWFAISETEKIINSNLGDEVDSKVLEVLKNDNNVWANKIEKIEKDSVTISMNKSIGLPVNSNSDIFYLINFLKISGRIDVFTIPNSDKDTFEKLINSTDTSTSRKSIVRLTVFGLFCGCILAVSIASAIEISGELIENSFDLRLKAKSIKDIWVLLTNPFIWIGLVTWWVILIINEIKNPYRNSWRSIFKQFPPFRIVSKFFNQ